MLVPVTSEAAALTLVGELRVAARHTWTHRTATGLDLAVDTTDASGVARGNLRVAPGQYWVHARYELPYTELYWNVPIDVVRGEPIQVRLTRENAEERISL